MTFLDRAKVNITFDIFPALDSDPAPSRATVGKA